MQTFVDIIDAWARPEELAAALGVTSGTIAVWKHRKSIPPDYWVDLVRVAQERGLSEVTFPLLSELRDKRRKAGGETKDAAA